MNPENPVAKLCVQGMKQEAQGNLAEASRLFLAAWSQSTDDFERCIAAHYVARHQKSPEDALTWNQRSLELARSVGDERVSGFFPSLFLNLGKAYEDLGKRDDARECYTEAQQVLASVPDNRYGTLIRDAVERGLERVRSRRRDE
jgi:tetratricopeptide (TPR) repeat protein